MAEAINVQKRTDVGTRASNRLRNEGRLPAVLYGHNEPSVSLSISYDDLNATLRHGAKVVEMSGDESGQALLQAMQWDTFGRYVLHADLLRVSAGDRVHVEIEVIAKGESPGEKDGGVLSWSNHSVEIEVPPADIPERLTVDISALQIGETITVSNILDLPKEAKFLTAPEQVLLNCVAPRLGEEETAGELGAAEPEVIGGKPGEESGESSGEDKK